MVTTNWLKFLSALDSAIQKQIEVERMGPVVIMGVAGCGKSSLAAALAQALGWPWIEGDAFHPAENVAKMRTGVALTDADRASWLEALAEQLAQGSQGRPGAILACSALKKVYRDRLRRSVPQLRFVFLDLTPEQAIRRVAQRTDHYFQPSLVESQFAALEKPLGEAGVLMVDATQSLETLQAQVCAWLQAKEAR